MRFQAVPDASELVSCIAPVAFAALKGQPVSCLERIAQIDQ
jgi:hypothetical protein